MNEALIHSCGSARFHLVRGGLIECVKCQKHIEARWAETNGFDWLNPEKNMRNTDEIEIKSIREKRTLHDRFLIRLFPKAFNRFAWSHISRAKQQGVISNDAMHCVLHYVSKDCDGKS